jgi:hypothetical protein
LAQLQQDAPAEATTETVEAAPSESVAETLEASPSESTLGDEVESGDDDGSEKRRFGFNYKKPEMPMPGYPPKPDYPDKKCKKDCDVKCPYNDQAYCKPLYTKLHEVVKQSDQAENDHFGCDNHGTLVYEQAGANSHQGAVNTAYPDLYRKTVAVENECAKNNFNEKEDWSGKRTKKFDINGCIKIVESQCGGLCEKKNSCENGTGKKIAKSLSRLGDAEAEVDKVCSCSGKPSCDHCCKKKCYKEGDHGK